MQTPDQRRQLVERLYKVLSLRAGAKDVKLPSYVDAIPQRVSAALVSVIKTNINGRPVLQDLIASLVKNDIEVLDQAQQKSSKAVPSKFAELLVEPLLKLQNTRQVIVSKLTAEKNAVEPFYRGSSGSVFNFSPLQSQLLTDKYLDLFYELFDRQKSKTGVKRNKKMAYNANWCQLGHVGSDDLTFAAFSDLTEKLSGQRNLLFIYEFLADKEKHVCCYFTFGQVEQPADKKQQAKANQKTTVPSQVGDFLLISQ